MEEDVLTPNEVYSARSVLIAQNKLSVEARRKAVNEKKELRVLAFGNSYSSDSLTYLAQIGAAEMINVQNTIPLVETDSRLGWEPSMEYIGHAENLEWKIRQLRYVLDTELTVYQTSVNL